MYLWKANKGLDIYQLGFNPHVMHEHINYSTCSSQKVLLSLWKNTVLQVVQSQKIQIEPGSQAAHSWVLRTESLVSLVMFQVKPWHNTIKKNLTLTEFS